MQPLAASVTPDNFTVTCPSGSLSANAYVIQAVGIAAKGTGGFTFTLNQDNVKQTTAVPSGWTLPSQNCFVQKKGGSMLARSPEQAGFSIIELCVGLTVLGILIGFAAPGMTAWMKNSQLRTTADSIQNGLQLARSEAVRRNALVTYTQSGTGWTVTNGSTTVQTGTSEASGTASVSASQSTVVFSGVGWVTPTADVTFDVTNPAGGSCAASGGPVRCLRVTVSAMGQIRMCDPAAASGTAAACS